MSKISLQEFSETILLGQTLEDKFYRPKLNDELVFSEEVAIRHKAPGRSHQLRVSPKDKRLKLPKLESIGELEHKVTFLHAFANHELMALELMAWALLAFAGASREFKEELVQLIYDEQRHLRMYVSRLKQLGVSFGELPLNDHFWRCIDQMQTLESWIATMNLTFEQANLDHAPMFAQAFRDTDDLASAAIMQKIYEDEINHVGFGVKWLNELKEDDDELFELYERSLGAYNSPQRGRGKDFNLEGRQRAGFDSRFIEQMRSLS